MVKTTSLSSAAINALTTGDSSILYNNQSRDIVLYSGSIGFVESSIFNLEINNINGECLILKNNSSATNYTNFNVSSTGQLNIITNGTDRIVNIDGHNGSNRGLSLGGTLITASANELNVLDGLTSSTAELNYVDTTPGTAVASKALVVDSNRDISNIRNLQTENLTVNGTLVTSSATELNYSDITTIGTAEPAKALVIDMNKDITGIRNLSATNLTGELQTASQPNITSVGTLTSLSTNSLTIDGTQVIATAEELNKISNATFNVSELNKLTGVTATTTELNYVDTTPGTAEASKALVVDSNRDISNIRNLQTENLTVNGTLVTSSATELNYSDITTIGTAEPAKALVIDMNKDITGIRNLSATNLTGELQTASQPNITSVGTLTSLSTNSLTINGTAITSTASELNILNGITASTAELNKLYGVIATTNEINKLAGLTTTTNQLNILNGVTATYTELNVLDGITSSTTELNYNDITTIGVAQAEKALVVDINKDISSIRNLSATNLTGTLATVSQPNITTLAGITSIGASGSTTLTGTLQTAAQGNVTSVGTLTGLTSSGAVFIANDSSTNSVSTGALKVTGGLGTDRIWTNGLSVNGQTRILDTISVSGALTHNAVTYNFMTRSVSSTQFSLLSNISGGVLRDRLVYNESTTEFNCNVDLSIAGTLKATSYIQVGTSTDTTRLISLLDNTMIANGMRFLTLGKSNDTGNQAEIAFGYVGNNSNDNYLALGFYGGERARITNWGGFLINGASSSFNTFGTRFAVDAYGPTEYCATFQNTSNTQNNMVLFIDSSGALKGSIAFGSGTLAYNTSSDYRLKKDIIPMQNGLELVSKIKPVRYKWKESNENAEGFLAHELQEILPFCVTGNKDDTYVDGSIKPQSVDYGKLTPILVSAVQTLNNEKDNLENRILELEEKNRQLEIKIENMLTRISNLEN